MTSTSHHAEKTFWIVAADEAQAIFYKRDTMRAPLHEFLSLENASVLAKQRTMAVAGTMR